VSYKERTFTVVEFYTVRATHQAWIKHQASGEMIPFQAVVLEGPAPGQVQIRYSHTFKPTEGSGFYYSNSQTRAESVEHAETVVRGWADRISKAPEFTVWQKELVWCEE
jgi:hypothetical protein